MKTIQPVDLAHAGFPFIGLENAYAFAVRRAGQMNERQRIVWRNVEGPHRYPRKRWVVYGESERER